MISLNSSSSKITQMTGISYCTAVISSKPLSRVAPVAAADDHGPVGMRQLQADGAVDVSGHRAERAGLPEVLTLLQLDEVREPRQVRAGVGEQDRSRGEHPPDRLGELAGMNRIRQVDDVPGLVVLAVDVGLRDVPDLRLERSDEGGNRRSRIGDDRVVGLVGLVDLVLGDVDVDQPLVLEQVLAVVERGVLVERVADAEDDVGLEEGLPGAGVAGVAEDARPRADALRTRFPCRPSSSAAGSGTARSTA